MTITPPRMSRNRCCDVVDVMLIRLRARCAQSGGFAAKLLACSNDERVIFVEKLRIARQRRFEQRPQFLVRMFGSRKGVPFQNPSRIRINHKYSMLAGIKQNRVRSLRSDAMNGEKLLAQRGSRPSEHARERTAIIFIKKMRERLQFFSFLPEIAGGTHETCKLSQRDSFHSSYGQHPRFTKVLDCGFNIRPRSVLRQNRAHNHFESRPAWPPMLRPVRVMQGLKIIVQDRKLRIWQRPRVYGDNFGHGHLRVDRIWQSCGKGHRKVHDSHHIPASQEMA